MMLIGYRYYSILFPSLKHIEIARLLYQDYRFGVFIYRTPEKIIEKRKNIIKKLKVDTEYSNYILNMINDYHYIYNYLLNYSIKEFKEKYNLLNCSDKIDIIIEKYLKTYNIFSYRIVSVNKCSDINTYIHLNQQNIIYYLTLKKLYDIDKGIPSIYRDGKISVIDESIVLLNMNSKNRISNKITDRLKLLNIDKHSNSDGIISDNNKVSFECLLSDGSEEDSLLLFD
ncbi:hypothetical protein SLOPH_1053 [Spraguea lophii 42_110]|uniref:Uncharacterized protein n=1 Tax=Spraguea lophii (strain 42_110) TaxID=1358809 RepID=S7XRX1_SPRLO|nr:hypothetical protein SLOPH_1053 [Spraguea lophii 42_110]